MAFREGGHWVGGGGGGSSCLKEWSEGELNCIVSV